jgi:hypothetical protein
MFLLMHLINPVNPGVGIHLAHCLDDFYTQFLNDHAKYFKVFSFFLQ